ncbi:MAG TPA: hypothetical protein DC047_06770, partial [Blastocatellia bacterium]|nr:hypothetical protein [Blastocatellia bacterium]
MICYTPQTEWPFIFLDRTNHLERETLEMDVVFVGAGPANLSGALHLAKLIKTHNEQVASGRRTGAP